MAQAVRRRDVPCLSTFASGISTAQAVNRCPLTMGARVRSERLYEGYVLNKMTLEQGFLPVLLLFHVSTIPPVLIFIHLSPTLYILSN